MSMIYFLALFFFFSLLAFADDILDIKPPVEFPPKYVLLYSLIAIVILIISLFLTWFLRRKNNYKPADEIKSPRDRALERLSELKNDKFLIENKFKEFFSELSLIVRQYIEEDFKIRAPEMTTQEFLEKIKQSEELKVDQKELLREFLKLCDMVKFAKYGPQRQEADQAFVAASQFIQGTKRP